MSETKIKINPEDFLSTLPTIGEEKQVFVTEQLVDRYLVDILNEAGITAEMVYQDTSYYIVFPEYDIRAFITLISLASDPVSEILRAIEYLSDEINSSDKLESWYSYSNGEHFLHIREKANEEESDGEIEEETGA